MILITNDPNFIAKLDTRIRSRLLPDLIEFKPYNLNETESILKQRTEYAFSPNSLDKEAFDLVVKKAFEIGDLRTGLFLLKQAGEVAENKSSKKIDISCVKNAIDTLALIDLDNDPDLLTITEIIKENPGKNKTEIFKIYEDKGGSKSYRTFQRKIKELEDNGKIKVKEIIDDLGKQDILEYLD